MPFDLKSLKSLFVVEDENAKQKTASGKVAQPSPPPPDPAKVMVQESASGDPGKVTPKFTEILFGALEKANLQGVDYLEYRQSLKSLEKMPMDEQVRFQSAYAMAQAMGATPQQLIESASHYIDVLKGEEAKFEQALSNQQRSQIASRQEKLQQLNATIQQKAAQIKKLTEEMEKHRADMEQLTGEISEATTKVESTKNDFIASYNALVAQILGDVEKMKRYLK